MQPFLQLTRAGLQLLIAHARLAVDLGGHGGQHRRAGRHLDDVQKRAIRLGQLIERVAEAQGQVMRRHAPLSLGQQIDANIGLVGAIAHAVVPHQTVEVNRRGQPHVTLIVKHLVLASQKTLHLKDQALRILVSRPWRQLEQHLQLVAAVKGQHLQGHLEEHQQSRGAGQQKHHDYQQPGITAAQKWPDHAAVKPAHPERRALALLHPLQLAGALLQKLQSQKRHKCKGADRRERDRQRHIDGHRTHVRTHHAADKKHRRKGDNYSHRGHDHRR